LPSERSQIQLGILGFGEVGQGIGTGLRAEGLEHVAAYDIGAFAGPFSALKQACAREAGIALLGSPVELAAGADLIIIAVPAANSEEAAGSIADDIDARHLYFDLVSTTPAVKVRQAERLAAKGALIADGGIMSSPLHDGHRIIIKASGPGAARAHDLLTPWGMRIEVVSDKLGAATGIKILRSVVMKGLEALLHECAIGAERYGIREEVLETTAEFMDSRPFAETAKFLIRSGMIHAGRRSGEAEMAAEALKEVGIEPIMTDATTRMLARVADLGMKEHFGNVVPDDWHEAVAAVDAALRKRDGAC
jgi:3-hydroxyisobutyrate dehydrogenase-like beta-hydroxyacid dehydrogenase